MIGSLIFDTNATKGTFAPLGPFRGDAWLTSGSVCFISSSSSPAWEMSAVDVVVVVPATCSCVFRPAMPVT